MHAALPLPLFSLSVLRPAELRVDVDPSEERGAPLAALYARMRRRGDRLHGLPTFRLHDPRFMVHVRSVGGELHAYVEDVQRQCLAGCTVFNRLAEVDRRADRHLRSPHSRYLGREVAPDDLGRLETRMFLLPPRWSLPAFLAAVGVRIPRS